MWGFYVKIIIFNIWSVIFNICSCILWSCMLCFEGKNMYRLFRCLLTSQPLTFLSISVFWEYLNLKSYPLKKCKSNNNIGADMFLFHLAFFFCTCLYLCVQVSGTACHQYRKIALFIWFLYTVYRLLKIYSSFIAWSSKTIGIILTTQFIKRL